MSHKLEQEILPNPRSSATTELGRLAASIWVLPPAEPEAESEPDRLRKNPAVSQFLNYPPLWNGVPNHPILRKRGSLIVLVTGLGPDGRPTPLDYADRDAQTRLRSILVSSQTRRRSPDLKRGLDQEDVLHAITSLQARLARSTTYALRTEPITPEEFAAVAPKPRGSHKPRLIGRPKRPSTDAGPSKLLTAAEEISLAQRLEQAQFAKIQLENPGLTPQKRAELEAKVPDGLAAREIFINANNGLVFGVARKYIGRGIPLPDLVQEGQIGLIKAVEKYDWHRGYRFSTHATWWIRQAITKAIADQSRTIRLPVGVDTQVSRLRRTQAALEQKLGRNPTAQELADSLNTTPKKIAQLLRDSRPPASLEQPIGHESDGEFTVGSVIVDEASPDPAKTASPRLLREEVAKALADLPSQEAEVLIHRFGLQHGIGHTLEEVGQKFGYTRERARQIEAKALERLRLPKHALRLRDHL